MAEEISILEAISISVKLLKALNSTFHGARYFLKEHLDIGGQLQAFEDDIEDCESKLDAWADDWRFEDVVTKDACIGLSNSERWEIVRQRLTCIDLWSLDLALFLEPLIIQDEFLQLQLTRAKMKRRDISENSYERRARSGLYFRIRTSTESPPSSEFTADFQDQQQMIPDRPIKVLKLKQKIEFVWKEITTISAMIEEIHTNINKLEIDIEPPPDPRIRPPHPQVESWVLISNPLSETQSSSANTIALFNHITHTLDHLLVKIQIHTPLSPYHRPPTALLEPLLEGEVASRLADWANVIKLTEETVELIQTSKIYLRVNVYLKRISEELARIQKLVELYGRHDWIGSPKNNLQLKTEAIENSWGEIIRLVDRLFNLAPFITNYANAQRQYDIEVPVTYEADEDEDASWQICSDLDLEDNVGSLEWTEMQGEKVPVIRRPAHTLPIRCNLTEEQPLPVQEPGSPSTWSIISEQSWEFVDANDE